MRNLKSLFRLLLPYISIVFLSVVSIGYLGWLLAEGYQERRIEDREKSIEIAMERFLERIDRIEKIAYIMEGNVMIREYAYSSLKNEDILLSDCIKVIGELENCASGNGLYYIYLYDRCNDRIITINSMTSYGEDFFRYSYQITGMTSEECLERLKGAEAGYSPVVEASINKNTKNVMEYRTRVPASLSRENALQMVFVIDAEELFGDFYDIMEEDCEFYV